jgi:erythromycin esterase-like protein
MICRRIARLGDWMNGSGKRRWRRLGLAAAAALALPAGLVAAEGLRPHSIDAHGEYRAADYVPVTRAIGHAPVVALGESIHMTREMPLVRLNVLRHLHETRGVDALVLEGSLLDAWTAQEHAYRSTAPLGERARTFTREALFGLWQTDEMEKVIAWALGTQKTGRPVYIASFDLQPGSARARNGSSQLSMDAFASALGDLDPKLDPKRAQGWSRALGPALGCTGDLEREEAVADLERWIASRAGPVLESVRPPAHLAALRLAPQMIRGRLQHCRAVKAAGRSRNVYQQVRDLLNARLVGSLMREMPRLVLWAHHSHVHHNSLRRSVPSMGQHLKSALGERLYTVGVFAGGGAATDSLRADASSGPGIVAGLAARRLSTEPRFGVEKRLSGLSDRDFFVDLRSAPAIWAQPDFSRAEVSLPMPTALAQDYDGAILIQEVSGAELNFLPAPFRSLVRLTGWTLQHPILATLGALLLMLGLGAGTRALWRRWRSRRSLRTPADPALQR